MRPISRCTGLVLTLLLSKASFAQIQEPVPPSPNLQWDLYSAIRAEFEHTGFRTKITDVSDFVLGQDQGDGHGLIVLGGGRESGIVSWQSDNETDPVGPQVIVLASPITDEQLNAWLADPQGSQVDPTLFIPVTESGPPPVIDAPVDRRYWSNDADVVARIFVRSCFDDSFRTYGDVGIAKGSATFVTWTNEQGEPDVEFSATGSSLTVSKETWAALLAACELKSLPTEATTGIATNFSGSSVQPPYEPDTLPSYARNLVDKMRAMLYSQSLAEELASPLLEDLNTASILSLRSGQSDGALEALDGFRITVADLASQGLIDVEDSNALIGGADELSDEVRELVTESALVPNVLDFCPGPAGECLPKEPCTRTLFHVSQDGSPSKPNGSLANPYQSIRQALRRAEAGMMCGVDLIVDQGVYIGDLTITRDTHIAGRYPDDPVRATLIRGTIENHGPFDLVIDDVTISFPSGDGIVSDHPCATTTLNDVQILGARGYGIHHLGGGLRATRTAVSGTRVFRPLSTGTGILMTCGAQGELAGVRMTANQSAGLVLTGHGTRVGVLDLTVTGTGIHPGFISRVGSTWGAVHVQDEAQLTGFGYSITDNVVYGLRVESGAEVTLAGTMYTSQRLDAFDECLPDFRWENDPPNSKERCPAGGARPSANVRTVAEMAIANALIARTRGITDVFGEMSGASNVQVGGGLLQLTNFHLDDADLAGISLARRGEADLNTGIVSRNRVGAAVYVPGFDISRIENEVEYRDNGTQIQATSNPVSDPTAELSPPVPD
jgi:hypothetical protein